METGRPTWSSRVGIAAAGTLIVLVLSLLVTGGNRPATVIIPLVIAVLAVGVSGWALTRSQRQRQEYDRRLATWAGERAAQAERLRIARELHDLVSHGLGLITVRAASAQAAAPGGDERSAALADIEHVSRETTTELRRMLAVLRSPNPDVATAPAPLRPVDTLADLPTIVQTARDAGLEVTLEAPELGEVSPGAQLTVCAIVREAVNNTLRHAGPTSARVAVRRDHGSLVVTVCDDGPATDWKARSGAGHGLTGLRERVAALGGTLQVGPSGRGFALVAHLPDEAPE